MNIFVLDEDPTIAARYNCDTHVCKIILESAQLLALAHIDLTTAPPQLNATKYKVKSFANHPITKWVCTNKANYKWLSQHAVSLCEEYTLRYGRAHATEPILRYFNTAIPNLQESAYHSDFVQAMPDEYKRDCAIEAYRVLYKTAKRHLVRYRLGNIPHWFLET